MEFKALELRIDEDFATFCEYITKLYTELFGPRAVPSAGVLSGYRAQSRGNAPKHWVFVAQASKAAAEPIALFTLAESFALFAGGRYAILGELWVHPDHRSKGVGRQVIEFCDAFAREQGYRRIDVTAPVDAKWDRSYKFYLQRGFQPTGRKLKLLIE
jgi:GNAT superfamily N-acetyltransferase